MSDNKSKLPDFKELTSMTNKLYTDIKKSVGEIIKTYKDNRVQEGGESKQTKEQTTSEAKPESKSDKEKPDEAKADENKK